MNNTFVGFARTQIIRGAYCTCSERSICSYSQSCSCSCIYSCIYSSTCSHVYCACVCVSMHTLQQTTIGIVLCQKQSRCRQSVKRKRKGEEQASKQRRGSGAVRGRGWAGNRRQLNYLRVKHVRLTQQMRTWHRSQRQQNYAHSKLQTDKHTHRHTHIKHTLTHTVTAKDTAT